MRHRPAGSRGRGALRRARTTLLGDALLRACIEVGCHYVDISDDREYSERVQSRSVRGFSSEVSSRRYGCSSSSVHRGGAGRRHGAPRARRCWSATGIRRARAAVASLLRNLDRSFADGVGVRVPGAVGLASRVPRDRAGQDRVARVLSVPAGDVVAVGHGPQHGFPGAKLLVGLGRLFSFLGRSGGAVICEDQATNKTACVHGPEGGQRMAALPAVFAARALERGVDVAGAMTVANCSVPRSCSPDCRPPGFRSRGPNASCPSVQARGGRPSRTEDSECHASRRRRAAPRRPDPSAE